MSSEKAHEIKQRLKKQFDQNPITQGGEGKGITEWVDLTNLIMTALFSNGHILLTDHRSSGSTQLLRAIADTTSMTYDHMYCDPHMLSLDDVLEKSSPDGGDAKVRMLFLENFPNAKDEVRSQVFKKMRSASTFQTNKLDDHLLIVATENWHSDKKVREHNELESFTFRMEVPDLKRRAEQILLQDIQRQANAKPLGDGITLNDLALVWEEIGQIPIKIDLQEKIYELADLIRDNEETEKFGGPSTVCLEEFYRVLKANCFWSNENEVTKKHLSYLAQYAMQHRIIRTPKSIISPKTIISRALSEASVKEESQDSGQLTVGELEKTQDWERAWKIYKKLRDRIAGKVLGRIDDAKEIELVDGKPPVKPLGTIDLVLTALFANGHVLLEDFPGTGKSYLAKILGESIHDDKVEEGFDIPSYNRIQCTPDLLPQDITGYTMLKDGKEMEFSHGPVFAYIVLVDEINRTTPKVQSGLLEAMAESQVTIEGKSHSLGSLFFCIATQNPLDKTGTFPLPAAQLDRFLFKRRLDPIDEDHVIEVMLMDMKKGIKDDETNKKNKVTLTEVVAVREFILKYVNLEGMKEWNSLEGKAPKGSLPRFLNLVAKKFREKEKKLPDGDRDQLRPGSTPSPRTLQRLIKVMQVQAFVDHFEKEERKEKRNEIVVKPVHFRKIATDLLRHRIVPANLDDLEDYEKEMVIDKLIMKTVDEAIEEHTRESNLRND